jgi:hypothetical protein
VPQPQEPHHDAL